MKKKTKKVLVSRNLVAREMFTLGRCKPKVMQSKKRPNRSKRKAQDRQNLSYSRGRMSSQQNILLIERLKIFGRSSEEW